MSERKCAAVTKAGKPCAAVPLTDSQYCLAHSDEEIRASVGFTGEAGKLGGRPRRPREIELIQEVAEEKKHDLRKALEEGLTATKSVVVGNGPSAHVQEVPDIPTRLKTVDMVLDRLHGKPKQATEISGPEGDPIPTSIVLDQETAEAARAVLRRAASTGSD